MTCTHCLNPLGMDWIEWTERHTLNLGEMGHRLMTVHSAVLCPPPRACAGNYAEARNRQAQAAARLEAEPF